MITKECSQNLKIDEQIYKKYSMNSIVYFDIETTGFDKKSDTTILISLGWFNDINEFKMIQYFADKLEDEKEILEAFKKNVQEFDIWCSFNGKAFDEPFICSAMEKYKIKFNAPRKHIDLYRIIRPYYKQLGLVRCNLKTVEKFVGIKRKDKIDGGICVELYRKYIQNKNESLKKTIMLHNFEDVLNLPKIFYIVNRIYNDNKLIRKDHITHKQLKYIQRFIKSQNIKSNQNLYKISKKMASKVIENIVKDNIDGTKINNIVSKSYFL